MTEVKCGDEVYAILVKKDSVPGSTWFGDKHEPIQAQRFVRPKDYFFKPHFHILNPRIIKRTQEAFVVINGSIRVEVYDKHGKTLGILDAESGDMVIIYKGGHGVTVTEDCYVYEIKAGQYTHVSEDKEYL